MSNTNTITTVPNNYAAVSPILFADSTKYQVFRAGRNNQPQHLDWTWTIVQCPEGKMSPDLAAKLDLLKMKSSQKRYVNLAGVEKYEYYAMSPLGETELETLCSVGHETPVIVDSTPVQSTPVQDDASIVSVAGEDILLVDLLEDLSVYGVKSLLEMLESTTLSKSQLRRLLEATKSQKRGVKLTRAILERLTGLGVESTPTASATAPTASATAPAPATAPVKSSEVINLTNRIVGLESKVKEQQTQIDALITANRSLVVNLKTMESKIGSRIEKIESQIEQIAELAV